MSASGSYMDLQPSEPAPATRLARPVAVGAGSPFLAAGSSDAFARDASGALRWVLAWIGEVVFAFVQLALGFGAWVTRRVVENAPSGSPGPQAELVAAPEASAVLMTGGLAVLAVLIALMLLRQKAPDGHPPPRAPVAAPPPAPPLPFPPRQVRAVAPDPGDGGSAGPQVPPDLDPDDHELPAAEVRVVVAEAVRPPAAALLMRPVVLTPEPESPTANGHGSAPPAEPVFARVSAAASQPNRPPAIVPLTAGEREAFARGKRAGALFECTCVKDLLDHLVETGLGQPIVLRQMPHFAVLRLTACRGCAGHPGSGGEGCPFETGFLEGAFERIRLNGVVVREFACCKRGDPSCDFEVWW